MPARDLSSFAVRQVGAALCRVSARNRFLVLTYHRVLAAPDPLLPAEPDAREFAAHLDFLRSSFNVLTLAEAISKQAHDCLPPRALCITFDDGYRNNYELALPLLLERGMVATFFVSTGFLGTGRMFNDTVIETIRRSAGGLALAQELGGESLPLGTVAQRIAAIDIVLTRLKYLPFEARAEAVERLAQQAGAPLPNDLMMPPEQVAALAGAGMEVGAHTVHHPILSRLDDAAAEGEIRQSKVYLEEICGRSVTSFAYPNGRPGRDFGRTHVEMVKAAGYRQAVTTAYGCATPTTDPLQIPRLAPWGRPSLGFGYRLLRGLLTPESERV